ncbi:hypothetical protein CPC08DRAFT_701773 [Agrocybe pediades]|nr:hypothetical protein CPC08DRAFT_701773 [Agrocybe pediades]
MAALNCVCILHFAFDMSPWNVYAVALGFALDYVTLLDYQRLCARLTLIETGDEEPELLKSQ